jgi:FlaA1/EpsC-like NDP-sugar epimerase
MCGRYEDTGDFRRNVYHGFQEGRYDKRDLIELVYPNMIVNGAFFEWGIFPSVWDKLFKKNLVEKFQMAVDESITMGEDAACTYPCLLNAESIYIINECLYHYRQTINSMVKKNEYVGIQRQHFKILYKSVNTSFERFKDIYDCRTQWREYLLFLMIPRADELLIGMENLEYLFPFINVKRKSNIIIYGMGTYGQHLYKYIERTKFCNILICVDRNYEELRKLGIGVGSPDSIDNYEYDAIVVASSFAKTRTTIYRELALKYSSDKVHIMDEDLIKSEQLWNAFGIYDEGI